MNKYKIKKRYSHILERIRYDIYKREFLFFWSYKSSKDSIDNAESLIAMLTKEGV